MLWEISEFILLKRRVKKFNSMWKNERNLWSLIKVVDSSLAEIVLKFQQFFFLLNNPQVDTGSLLLGEENFLLNISLDGTEMGLELEFMVVLEHWQQHCQNTFQNFLLKQQWSIQKYFPFSNCCYLCRRQFVEMKSSVNPAIIFYVIVHTTAWILVYKHKKRSLFLYKMGYFSIFNPCSDQNRFSPWGAICWYHDWSMIIHTLPDEIF